MNMKKTIILLGLLLVMNYTAFAEQRGIFIDFMVILILKKTRK